jgi:hypothetical protein
MVTTAFLTEYSALQLPVKRRARGIGLIDLCFPACLLEVYNFKMRRLRIALALVLLIISLGLLAWGVLPAARERHILPVPPSEMTLPTPASFAPEINTCGWM